MKKVLLPLALLLLLMIFCVWKHAGDFNKPMTYKITKNGQSYALKGSFKERSQIERLLKVFAENGASLKTGKNEINTLLNPKGSVPVVEKIAAHFIKTYKNGEISYAEETLTVSGVVSSDAAKAQMETLLHAAPIAVVNETQVVKPLPIEFTISQKSAGEYILSGDFSGALQKDALLDALLRSGAEVHVAGGINPVLADNDAVIETVKKVIPDFVKNLQEGEIRYAKGVLTVSGLAMEKPLLDTIKKDLSGAKVKVSTNLGLNLKAIKAKEMAIQKAKEEAARKAAEAKRKAAQAAKRAQEEKLAREAAAKEAARLEAEKVEKARLAAIAEKKAEEERQAKLAEEAAQKAAQEKLAQEEAARKAEEERQAKIAEALLQAQKEADARKAAQEARKAAAAKMAVTPAMSAEEIAKIKANRDAARKNIAALLEVEIIEFDSAKSSLTAKGENTVDKLALILQNYPLIKVEIAGHTDSDGNDKFNLKLSQSRVDTVKKELVSQGINAHRLKAIGYGETKPLVPNTTPENKQKNRRVEIIVIGE